MRRVAPLTLILLLSGFSLALAQIPSASRFVVTGYAVGNFMKEETQNSTFEMGSLNPILLFQLGDRVFFEGELEFELEEGETKVELEYAQLAYMVNDYLILGAGKFLISFDQFFERLHPAWINKLPAMPIMFQHHGGFLPTADLGLQARGAVPLNADHSAKLSYTFYVVNGPAVGAHEHEEEGEAEHEEEGAEHGHGVILSSLTASDEIPGVEFGENFSDNNGNKTVGGRLGLIPVPGLELGVSGFTGKYDDLSNLTLDGFGLDGSWGWRGLELRAELGRTFQDLSDGDETDRTGFYLQAAYRFTAARGAILPNLELVSRYEDVELPGLEGDVARWAAGANYYLSDAALFKVAYLIDDEEHLSVNNNRLWLQLAFGF